MPHLGRWASPDPLQVHSGGGGEFGNSYHYVSGSVLQARDPLGLWSSAGVLPVHQTAIDRVLGGRLSSEHREILKDQQVALDDRQRNEDQHMHAMTGAGISRQDAITEANQFVRESLRAAIKAYNEGETREAFVQLGNAIHTLQDASSPAHEGFQRWDADAPLRRQMRHVVQETQYPGDQFRPFSGRRGDPPSAEEIRRKTLLEGATAMAYDIFVQGVTGGEKRLTDGEPPDVDTWVFFDENSGRLRIPRRYGSTEARQGQSGALDDRDERREEGSGPTPSPAASEVPASGPEGDGE